MFNKSIAYRLSVYLSLAVISVFIAFILITFVFNSKIINENIENKAIEQSNKATTFIYGQLYTTREVSSNFADQVLYYARHGNVKSLISGIMEKYPFLNAVHVDIDSVITDVAHHHYFVYNSGDSLDFEFLDSKIYHCQTEKFIFEQAVKTQIPGWTEVFNCVRNGKMVIGYFCPITAEDEFGVETVVGSLIFELSLANLNRDINSLKIGENGYAVLLAADGTYLTHPNKDWVFVKNIVNTPSDQYDAKRIDIKKQLENRVKGSTIIYPAYLNYKKSWAYFSPIAETGWAILIVIPFDELYNPLYLLILRMLFIAVIGILVIFFIVTYISKRLIQPLTVVTSKLSEFSNLNGEIQPNTSNEVTIVSESLNYLQTWYKKFETDQQQAQKQSQQRRVDLIEASEIQMSLINMNFEAFNTDRRINLFGMYKPARIVSGDLFDYFFVDEENLFFTIGDVSGKGISAAFFMSVAQTIIKGQSGLKDPANIVYNVNNELFTTNQHQFFLTLFVGMLNVKTGLLRFCNAAHNSTFILNEKGKLTELIHTHGMPLGIYRNRDYQESELQLTPGDKIVLYTDGLTDLQNEDNVRFGIEKLKSQLKSDAKATPKGIVQKLENELDSFKGKARQTDDIAILTIHYLQRKKA